MKTKIKSFTLAELLVVMIITAIVVGIAFSVLRLVQKQIYNIQHNYDKSTTLSLFEQKLWQDFNEFHEIRYDNKEKQLVLKTELDSLYYKFEDTFVLRNTDTIKLKLIIDKVMFDAKDSNGGNIDALSIDAKNEIPKYKIFVFKKNDLTFAMNQEDGI
jgi:Na+-translocating ferredoxin:NAD+ oxidoreductase RnfG subunit